MPAATYSTRKKRNISKRKVKRETKASKKVNGSKKVHVMHRRSYKQRGGLESFSMNRTNDSKALFDHYLQKKVINNGTYNDVITKKDYNSIIFESTDLLMVIDMQNDFVDTPFIGSTGPEVGKDDKGESIRIGAFAVNNGSSIIEPIIELYNKVTAAGGKVVFSRDVHPCDHCSFSTHGEACDSTNKLTGLFPPHCVSGTSGSGFVKTIYDDLNTKEISPTIEAGDISVIFKGCDQATDSFGALPYREGQYANARQEPGCKHADMNNTGGFYAKADKTGKDGKEVLKDSFDAADKDNKGSEFKVPESIKRIFVVGLAGDYCVCDTAINLKGMYRGKEVTIIHDLTRNAFIPFGDFLAKTLLDQVKAGKDGTYEKKHLITYAFDFDPAKGGSKSLTYDARQKLDHIQLAQKFHFLQDPDEIFYRYLKAGVKVMVNT
jgi:nicotinamidase-related amidase